ncbi:helix-turn-helix transcriptional regulator [Pectobacterium brasiliense]|uniref:helix-turn-helix transcriptional regulator n=1 Tax=Pectobacterium brasiliense TaxID=180957 RepID=UPI0025A0B7BC|nr:AlpA family phage regulatory protein [Pectobacterium brasiliense]WJM82890.1 AlpA family phage regulatory protein [Pectobacterium brasiliense]
MSEKILREKAVCEKVSLDRGTLRVMWENDQFPAPFSITGGRAIGWREADIDEWIVKQSRAKRRAAVIARRVMEKPEPTLQEAVNMLAQPLFEQE